MKFKFTFHWSNKRKEGRFEIKDYMIEYCVLNSEKIKDRRWQDAWNAISRIQPSNRKLKVVYKIEGKTIKIITAYWLD